METLQVVILGLCLTLATGKQGVGPGNQDWGFYEVRSGAYMFYWLYYTLATPDPGTRPLVIWLQGGPGASSTGYGNFEELGIMDVNLNIRNTSWVNEVNVLFIDNPVGTGFSYVQSYSLLTKNNKEIAADLLTFMRKFMQEYPRFKTVPLYIFSESYGGKMAVEFALQLYKDILTERIEANLKGVALGDSWISPLDSVLSWAPFLLNTGVVDRDGYERIRKYAEQTKLAVESGGWSIATDLWLQTEYEIMAVTYNVDFYNILYKIPYDRVRNRRKEFRYRQHTSKTDYALEGLMNGYVKRTLDIPSQVIWGKQSNAVFDALETDFMKPVTDIVERLLNETDVAVVVFSGQLDLIVDTPGTLNWVERLNWPEKDSWERAPREPLVVDGYVEGYVKKNDKFSFYWIDRAGHMVPTDNPYAGLELLQQVTHYE